MLKRLLIAGLMLILVIAAGLYIWAHSIFSSDLVRTQVAAQLSRTLGQPVEIGRIGASIFPRVTMALGDVRIGNPANITIERLDVGTALRALLSRRIEHATAHLSGARIVLPLPPLRIGTADPSDDAPQTSAVTLVSVDEVVLRDVEIVSSGRTVRGNIELVPRSDGMTIRAMDLSLGEAAFAITGEISSYQGPIGELALHARDLNLLELLAFVSEFSAGAQPSAAAANRDSSGTASGSRTADMDVAMSIDANRVILGTLMLDALNGRARLTADRLALDPVSFRVFDGGYQGSLAMGLSDAPDFRMRASLDGLNMAEFSAFAGRPDVITGRLAGAIDVTGRGATPDRIVNSARGTARIDITQGSIKGLGLVRAVVLATSMREDSRNQATLNLDAEPFSRLGASLAIGGGSARTDDLRFESNDVLLSAQGQVALNGSAVDLAGHLQLSDTLSQQAGRDLLRYTQQDGRVTLPVNVSGSADQFRVSLDVADLMKRALINKTKEEAGEAIRRGLEDLLNRGLGR